MVLVVGAILIATDVIDTGDTTKVVEQAPISAAGGQPGRPRRRGTTVQDIYKQEGARRRVHPVARA